MKVILMYHNDFINKFKSNKLQKFNNELEAMAKKANRDSRIEKAVVFTLASLMYAEKVFAASSSATDKMDRFGYSVLDLLRHFGYWACIIMAILELIRSVFEGDTKAIGKIIMKYVLLFAALYFLPIIFDFIRDAFR